MPIVPLEPPEKGGDFHQKKLFRLKNGDVVIDCNGLQTQYAQGWLNNQSISVVMEIFKGLADHPIYNQVMQTRVQSMSTVNNPFAKPVKAMKPKYVSPSDYITSVKIVTSGDSVGYAYNPSPGDDPLWVGMSFPEDEGVPEIQEEPKDTKDRFVPRRMVEID